MLNKYKSTLGELLAESVYTRPLRPELGNTSVGKCVLPLNTHYLRVVGLLI